LGNFFLKKATRVERIFQLDGRPFPLQVSAAPAIYLIFLLCERQTPLLLLSVGEAEENDFFPFL
jgi:hypothetical protein